MIERHRSPCRAAHRAVPLFFLAFLSLSPAPLLAQADRPVSQPTQPSLPDTLVPPPIQAALPAPPTGVTGHDTPNDPGESIDIAWNPSPDEASGRAKVLGYIIERSTDPAGPFEKVGQTVAGTTELTDNSTQDAVGYYYRVRTLGIGEADWPASEAAGPFQSKGQWFDVRKSSTLLLTFLFCLMVVILIHRARRGAIFYIRPIPGLSAVDEAIGRATEMGRPILFVSGLGTAADVATLAAFTLLGRVAKKTAEYQTQVIVPCYDPIVMTISQEIVKSSYLDAGRPELYRQDDIYFVTQDQFPYTAAVNGIMLRDRPATNFYIGKFYAESLVLAETGNVAGSIQIAGTDEITQIPFFVAACDYTLIGEELYASSAYLSQEPPLLGTLKAQDYGKAVGAILIVVGAAMALLNQHWFVNFFRVE
jgi:hypothetical protein